MSPHNVNVRFLKWQFPVIEKQHSVYPSFSGAISLDLKNRPSKISEMAQNEDNQHQLVLKLGTN